MKSQAIWRVGECLEYLEVDKSFVSKYTQLKKLDKTS